jgi:hypothetical protein
VGFTVKYLRVGFSASRMSKFEAQRSSFFSHSDLLMKCTVPDSADNILPASDRDGAYTGLVKMFLDKEENARTEESKTGEKACHQLPRKRFSS